MDEMGGAIAATAVTAPVRPCTSLWATYARLMMGLALLVASLYFDCYATLFDAVSLIPAFAFEQPPRFYVVTTGTASFLSFLILSFEYCYYCRNGVSFIEQLSTSGDSSASLASCTNGDVDCDTRVAPNSMNLFRGADYERYSRLMKRQALTHYDVVRSAHDFTTWLVGDGDFDSGVGKLMIQAWRERDTRARIKAAEAALQLDAKCSTALILLAEEKATTVAEAESFLLRALNGVKENREHTVFVYIKRRLGMCARRLGRVKEATKVFKELNRDTVECANLAWLNSAENLIECYLEMGDYASAQATLAKYDNIKLPKSATICYTKALLMARLIAGRFNPGVTIQRGPTDKELDAIEAIHRAVEFNPHVPAYLLEQKSLILPPEHILKRGDSEAVAYAFHHLKHWKQIDGALNVLHSTWEGTFRCIPSPLEKGLLFFPYPANIESVDRDLLPEHHEVSVFPRRELPVFIVFSAILFIISALLAFFTHQYPDAMKQSVHYILAQCGAAMGLFKWPSNSFWLAMSEWKVFGVPPWLAQRAWGGGD